MEQVEANQITMMTNIDSMQEKMDRLLETLLSMARREGNLEITVDARNIVAQIGLSSLEIPGVINLEFRFHPGYVHPKAVVVPPPVAILMVNLGAQNHSDASTWHRSLYEDKDPFYAFYMPP